MVGWYAQITRSPDRSDVASGLSNVTQTRSNRSHHSLRLYSWVRCPPDEQTSSTTRIGSGRGHESRRDPASGVDAGSTGTASGEPFLARGLGRSGLGDAVTVGGHRPTANAIEARQRRAVVIVGRLIHPVPVPVPVPVGPSPASKRHVVQDAAAHRNARPDSAGPARA